MRLRLVASIAALGLLAGAISSAWPASTINPTVPAQNSTLTSSVVRNNFAAAYNDVSNILGMYAGTSAPGQPVVGQDWLDTTNTPAIWKKRYNNGWSQVATFNLTTGSLGITAGLVVGTSAIIGGTDTRVLYNNNGILGEYAITGTGSVAMSNSPTFVTPVLGAATGTSLSLSAGMTAGSTSFIGFTGRALIFSPGDGVVMLRNNSTSGFSLLQFGGSDASYPAWKRNGANIELKLADDSDYADMRLGTLAVNDLTADRLVATNGTKQLSNSITSANLLASITDPTGTGAAVFANTPTLVTPNIGAATGTTLSLSGNMLIGAAQQYYWVGRSTITSPADGYILLRNNAATDFGLLQLGGTTSSFPAFKRSTTNIQFRLADDSGYAGAVFNNAVVDGLTANRLVSTDGSKILSSTITSANLAASISDETGSGAAVFGTGPSLSSASINGLTVTGSFTATAAAGFTITAGSVTWSGTIPAANLPVVADASGSPSATFGVMKCDGTTTTCSSGTVTAIGGAATDVTVGTTTVTGGTSGYVLYNNAGVLGNLQTTGSGNVVRATTPTLVTPVLGAATATSINGLTITSSTGTLTVTNGKTASFSNSIVFAGTDSTTMTFPNASATIPRVVASGAKALATGAISSGTCTSAQTDTATNTVTTDAISASFSADPTSTTGYSPSTSGMLSIIAWPTANTVNFKVCNNTAASITPGAVTINWRVVR